MESLISKLILCGPESQPYVPVFMQLLSSENELELYEGCVTFESKLFADAQSFMAIGDYMRAYDNLGIGVNVHVTFMTATGTSFLSPDELHQRMTLCCEINIRRESYEVALVLAQKCIKLDPQKDKGYFNTSRIYQKLGNHEMAATYILKMYCCADSFQKEVLVKSLILIADELIDLQGNEHKDMFMEYSQRPSFFADLPLELWENVVSLIIQCRDFKALALLTTGSCGDQTQPFTYIYKIADVPGLRFTEMDVGHMLRQLKQDEGETKAWHIRLAEFVMMRGANPRKIEEAFDQPLLVAMTDLSVEGEVPSFLDFAWGLINCQQYDDVDKEGNSPLHSFVKALKQKKSLKMAEVVLRALLNKGCQVLIKDKAGKLPQEYIQNSFPPLYKILSNAAKTPDPGMMKRLTEIREKSNDSMKSSDLNAAMSGYVQATVIAEKYHSHFHEQLSILYSNIAVVYLKRNQPGKAVEVLSKSLSYDKSFVKSYFRLGQAHSSLREYVSACKAFRAGYDWSGSLQVKLQFCLEAVYQITKIPENQLRKLLEEDLQEMVGEQWPDLLSSLTKSSRWDEVAVLVVGPPHFHEEDIGLMGQSSCRSADLRTIFDKAIETGQEFDHVCLLLFLVDRDAKLETLAASEDDTYFHALTRVTAKNGWSLCKLMSVLDQSALPKDFVKLDGQGRTALHTLCQESKGLCVEHHLIESFQFMLSHNIDVEAKDKNEKQALDYCQPGSQLFKAMQAFKWEKDFSNVSKTSGSGRSATSSINQSAKQANISTSLPKSHHGDLPEARRPNPSTWQELKEEGNRVYGKKDYKRAIELYQRAIQVLEDDSPFSKAKLEKLSDAHNHNLAILYGNCAECHFQLGNIDQFFENAKQNVNYDGDWYKGHHRVARAFMLKENYGKAVTGFVNSYNLMKFNEKSRELELKILKDLMEAAFELKGQNEKLGKLVELKDELRELKVVSSDIWVRLSLNYINKHTSQDWRRAESIFKLAGDPVPVMEDVDFGIFCRSLDDKACIGKQTWICSLVMWVIDSKASIETLSAPNGHFLNATINLVAESDSSILKHPDAKRLLITAVMHAKSQGEINWQKNLFKYTALHLVVGQRRWCQDTRQFLASLLIESGIDVLLTNAHGERALDMTDPNDPIRAIIEKETSRIGCQVAESVGALLPELCRNLLREFEPRSWHLVMGFGNPSEQPLPRPDRGHSLRTLEQYFCYTFTIPNVKGALKRARHSKAEPSRVSSEPKSCASHSSTGVGKKASKSSAATGFANQTWTQAEVSRTHGGAKARASQTPCSECDRLLKKAQDWQNQSNLIPIYEDLIKIVRFDHRTDNRHHKFRNESLNIIAKMLLHRSIQEIPKCVLDLKAQYFCELISQAAAAKKWSHLKEMVLSFKRQKGQKALAKFAKDLCLDQVVGDGEMEEEDKIDLIKLMSSHGAVGSSKALKDALAFGQWQLALILLDLRIDPVGLTLTSGDTPLHAAVQVAIHKVPGNQEILKKLRQMWENDKKAYSYLDVACKDKDGKSLMHLAAQCDFSNYALAVVERLCSWNCPVDLLDNNGYTPLEYLKSNDRRAEYLRSSSSSSMGAKPKKGFADRKLETDAGAMKLKQQAVQILSDIPDAVINYMEDEELMHNEEEDEEEEEEDDDGEDIGEEDEDEKANESNKEDSQIYSISDDDTDIAERKSAVDVESNTEIDVKVFDDLLWDIECTEEAWSLLKTKSTGKEGKKDNNKKPKKERIPAETKSAIVRKLRQLGSGDWRPNLQRKIHGVPDSLVLYKMQLPDGASLLWELAIAFSPRLSQNPTQVLAAIEANMESGTSLQEKVMNPGGGRIYSQIIRVWSVVLKDDEITDKIKDIVSSHNRGKDCIVQKKLKGLPSSQYTGASASVRNPALYMEQDTVPTVSVQKEIYDLTPPASSRKKEFQILKFYSFSSSLVTAILSNKSVKIDLPFRVTEHENALIYLQSEAPILLLGRSGTGKTTCCLYRLWGSFLKYWETAVISEPLLPWINPEFADEIEEPEVSDGTPCKEKEEMQNAKPEDEACRVEELDTCDEGLASASDDDIKESDDDEDNKTDADEDDENVSNNHGPEKFIYSHKHQLFVTKNPKLCSEVQKNFLKLRHVSENFEQHNSVEKDPLPNTLQNVEDLAFPLFLTSRQLLLLLDASVDEPYFFPRDEDGDLRVIIPGWGTQEDIFTIIPLQPTGWLDSDEEDSDDDEAHTKRMKKGKETEFHHQFGGQKNLKTYLRRECTFEVFANDVWPKIAKKAKIQCHPSLVWTEIMSFIQGSYEALNSDNGHLTESEYLSVGHKIAPNFTGDRVKVFAAYQLYRKHKQNHQLFDESDLVYSIYQRLRQMKNFPWVLHEIYVDETQDFTQAELALLLRLCQDPNKMFLSGDTAQAIMRGISFRFSDLRSLFRYVRDTDTHPMAEGGWQSVLKVPEKIHQLRYNYRSHTGILSLASAVLDVLHRFFPESFDQLKRDQGMFEGPKPVIIESCSSDDLAMLLSGNQRSTRTHIEFGAHQAILVASEESKQSLPSVLTSGIVLTIFEAKGLEFDDVLLYNFFTDSQACKEWRVVTDFLDTMVKQNACTNSESLVEIDAAVLEQVNRPRPLSFDPEQHKILSSELKHLYTALTRARANVWIFDEDEASRAPMFEYFKARKLVQCMEGDESDIIFAQKSSKRQWKKTGDFHMSREHFALAAKCYREASQPEKETLALAFLSAKEGSQLLSRPGEMKVYYLKAAVQFAMCHDLHHAAVCFQNARERGLAALAYKKNGEMEAASKQYLYEKKPEDASSCLEQAGMFRQAIAVLEEFYMYDRAIDCLNRFQMKMERVKSEKGNVPKALIENCPKETQSKDELCHRAANFHFKNKEYKKAQAAIMRLDNKSDQVIFLERNGYWEEAAKILADDGNRRKASEIMLKAGQLDRADHYAKEGMHKSLRASILLAKARKLLDQEVKQDQSGEAKKDTWKEEVKKHVKQALSLYTLLMDRNGQGQVKLILGKLEHDSKMLKDARGLFHKCRNHYGGIESYHAYLQTLKTLSREEILIIYEKLPLGFTDITRLVSERLEGMPELFYGFEIYQEDSGEKRVRWYPGAAPLCDKIFTEDSSQMQANSYSIDSCKAIVKLVQHLLSYMVTWVKKAQGTIKEHCDHLSVDKITKSSVMAHLELLTLAAAIDYNWQTGLQKLDRISEGLLPASARSCLRIENRWTSARKLLDVLISDSPRPWCSDGSETYRMVTCVQSNDSAVRQVVRYEWDNQGRAYTGGSNNLTIDRCKSTDWIVRAGFLCSLLKSWNLLDVSKEVQDIEQTLCKAYENKGFTSEEIYKLHRLAVFEPIKLDDGGVLFELMGSKFLDFLNNLMVDQKLVEAVYALSHFLMILGKRASTSLMPDWSHLVFWLEVYFSITLFLGSRMNKGARFYMSSGLFSAIEMVNVCIKLESIDGWTVQQMATDQNIKSGDLRFVQRRQTGLLHFLLGGCQYSKFGLLRQVPSLCEGEKPRPILAERIVLLSVLTILNTPGEFVSRQHHQLMLKEFEKLGAAEGKLPSELSKLIRSTQSAATFDDIAVATQDYLDHKYGQTDKAPFLCLCTWDGRFSCPVRWRKLFRGEYKTNMELDLIKDSSVVPGRPLEEEVQSEAVLEEDREREKAEELRARAKHEKIMKIKAQEQTKSETTPDPAVGDRQGDSTSPSSADKPEEKGSEVEQMFQLYSEVNDTECEICNEGWGSDAGLRDGEMRQAKSRDDEKLDDSDTGRSESTDTDERAKHIASEGHIRKQKQFEEFKKCYATEIHPVLEGVQKFLSNASSVLGHPSQHLVMSRVDQELSNFEEAKSNLLKQRKWEQVEKLKGQCLIVKAIFNANKESIDKEVQDKEKDIKKGDNHQERMQYRSVEDDVQGLDPNSVVLVNPSQRKGPSQSQGNRNAGGRYRYGKNNYQMNKAPRFQKHYQRNNQY